MAATLPPIPGTGMAGMSGMTGMTQASSLQRLKVPTPPSKSSNNRQILKPIKVQGKKDSEMEAKRNRLRAQQPLLTKAQTSTYRNTYKHSLCLDMLQEGFHKSYGELFALIRRQQEERHAAGPESILWSLPQLEDQQEKLDMLKLHLTMAESADRKEDYTSVYRSRFELAQYFQTVDDKWLVDHFFTSCLNVSRLVREDGGRMLAEGFCNVGLAQEENGDYFDAVENFEAFDKLATENKDWLRSDGLPLVTDACIHMSRIYTTIGNVLEKEDPQQSLPYFKKAYFKAKESGERKLSGETAYRLGLAYEQIGDGATALQHLNIFLEVCKASNDTEGVGRACDAIARAYKQQGRIEECIHYLQMFVEVTENNQQEKAFSRACHNLGAIYNSLGRYGEATEYFSKAYNLSRAHNDAEAISVNRVQYGIAMAHKMLQGFSKHVVAGNRPCLERVGEWKSSRGDEFGKDIPQPAVEPEPVTKSTSPPPPTDPQSEPEASAEEGEASVES